MEKKKWKKSEEKRETSLEMEKKETKIEMEEKAELHVLNTPYNYTGLVVCMDDVSYNLDGTALNPEAFQAMVGKNSLLSQSGIEIMSVYLYGSKSMAYDSANLITPDIQWLGVRPSDIKKYKIPKHCILTSSDMLEAGPPSHNLEWKEEIEKKCLRRQKR
ncbi:Spo11/DNA topoisomerase VI subunit A [Parasponia andersonii]|uniref:Spo11/DNA topoisomerase VI subunit A n=1 Tax=Parasponia andersonii TaxID=3476 RepID=A0A2P5AC46_PARAD|nr:Spo11/DNA topoisomerase VI subunit A [Parasponia andersonii]